MTYKLIKEIKPDFGLVSFTTPIPGTELYSWFLKKKKNATYKDMLRGWSYDVRPLINLSKVSDKVLKEYVNKIRKYYYIRNFFSMLKPKNISYLIKLILYIFSNLDLVIKSFQTPKANLRERTKSNKIYHTLYEMQRGYYYKKKKSR